MPENSSCGRRDCPLAGRATTHDLRANSPATRSARVNLLLAILLVAGAAGCERGSSSPQSAAAQSLPTVSMRIGSRTYTLEVAADEETRRHGLMGRAALPPDRGMIFVFPDEAMRGFWMKNTLVPLDILFLDRGGRVVSTHTMRPRSEETTMSGGPAQYAVELNEGQIAASGVKSGYLLEIPPAARLARD